VTRLLLAFTVVGYNLDRIRSFLAKKAQREEEGGEAEAPGQAQDRNLDRHRVQALADGA
jgi:hypothetical protein